MSGQLASKRELRRRAMVDGLRATIDEQSARIAELESQLALALPAQRFAGARLQRLANREEVWSQDDAEECGLIRPLGCGVNITTPAGEAALAAWRASQQEANDATT